MNHAHLKLAQLDAQRDPLASAWDCIADAAAQGDETLRARAEEGEKAHNAQHAAVRLASYHRSKAPVSPELERERQRRRDYYTRNAEAVKAKAAARYHADLEQSRAKERERYHRRKAEGKG